MGCCTVLFSIGYSLRCHSVRCHGKFVAPGKFFPPPYCRNVTNANANPNPKFNHILNLPLHRHQVGVLRIPAMWRERYTHRDIRSTQWWWIWAPDGTGRNPLTRGREHPASGVDAILILLYTFTVIRIHVSVCNGRSAATTTTTLHYIE